MALPNMGHEGSLEIVRRWGVRISNAGKCMMSFRWIFQKSGVFQTFQGRGTKNTDLKHDIHKKTLSWLTSPADISDQSLLDLLFAEVLARLSSFSYLLNKLAASP